MAISPSSISDSRKGFTVIELIITFAIVTALMAATAPSAAFNRREYILSTNQEQLRSLISRAKSLTLSGLLTSGEREEKICGYGIRIVPNDDVSRATATIFKETLTGQENDCPRDNLEGIVLPNESTLLTGTLNQMTFDKALTISLSAGNAPPENPASTLDIYFLAPDPTTIIVRDGGTSGEDTATIKLELAPSSRQIKLNRAGLIDLIYGTGG
jgi:type II secretory pathway pseudopilin PulG